MNPDKFFNL